MSRSRSRFYGIIFGALLLLTAVVLCLNILIGSTGISVSDVLQHILHPKMEDTISGILWKIRIPRAIAALLLGGALSLSGYLLQTFFHNPIAGPFVLGISSGAKLVVALVMIVAVSRYHLLNSAVMVVSAFAGSMIAIGFILLIFRKVRQMSMLVVCGVMIGYICSAVTEFVVTFADDSDIVNLHNWSMGTFSGMSMDDVLVLLVLIFPTAVGTLLLSKPISAYQLGEGHAENLGVQVSALRVLLILLSGILSACVTAFAGPISFVGIAVPHIMRMIFRTSKPIVLIPACFLGGSIFCMGCDMIARTVFAPTELSISTVTAIFGAPVVLAIMIRRKRGMNA